MDKQDVEPLMIELTCDDVIRCQRARRSLVSIGSGAVPSLVAALDSEKIWVRWEAAKALSQIGDPAATDALIKYLEHKEFELRWLAAEGLINIGRPAVVPLLRAVIDYPKSVWLLQGAHHVLHDMYRGDWDGILRPVMIALESFEPSVEAPVAAKNAIDILENLYP
jgi:hypothetical protein